MVSKCESCGTVVGYMEYHCKKCKKMLAGLKPRKSKSLCSMCRQNWYNVNKEKGCWGYKEAKVIIKNVYKSTHQVIPNPEWKLSCFNYNRG